MIDEFQILIANSRAGIRAGRVQVASAKRRLAASKQLLERMNAATAGSNSIGTAQAMPSAAAKPKQRTFAAIADLMEQVDRITRSETDAIDRLASDIRIVIQDSSETYLLVGVLAEGIVQSLVHRLSASEQRTALLALTALIGNRLDLGQ